MKEAFEKILERLEELIEKSYYSATEGNRNAGIKNSAYHKVKKIVQEVAEEYKGDMKYNLAEMYAKNMVDYGVDVTKAWQTATQQSCALEKAYIRGRQYEVDRFNELRKEYDNGWIPCSERLPEKSFGCIVTVMDREPSTQNEFENILPYFVGYDGETWNDADGEEIPFEVIAWMPLPEPYNPKGE